MVGQGDRADRFNLALVSEGFTADELDGFRSAAEAFASALLSLEPFSVLWEQLGLYRIEVASNQSGVSQSGSGTYFDAAFEPAPMDRLLLVDEDLVWDVVEELTPSVHAALVIANSQRFGGSGSPRIAVTSLANDWIRTSIHELGHAAFRLADEYDYWIGPDLDGDRDIHPPTEPEAPNVTTRHDRSTLKWLALVDASTAVPTMRNHDCRRCDAQASPVAAGTVGAFEGAHYYHCGAFRGAHDCIMRDLSADRFCQVCVDAIATDLRGYSDGS